MAFSGRFGMIPAALTNCEAVGLDEIGVLAVMSTYADRDGHCRVSQSTLARILKRSRPWVIKTINTLEGLGLVERAQVFDQRTGARRACAYRLRFDRLTGASETHPSAGFAEAAGAPDGAKNAPVEAAGAEPVSAEPIRFACPGHDRGRHRRDTIQTTPEQHRVSPERGGRGMGHNADRSTTVPADWRPSADDLAWASETHPWLDADLLTRQFIAGSAIKGYRYQDLSAGWRSWAENQANWRKRDDFRQPRRDSRPAGRSARPHAKPQAHGAADLAGRNSAAAHACLERILARRAVATPAG